MRQTQCERKTQNKREGNIKREKSAGRVNLSLKREKNNTHN